MTHNQYAFFRPGVKDGDKLEIPYQPWPLWFQRSFFSANANPMPAERGGIRYSGIARTSRFNESPTPLIIGSDWNDYKTGDSHVRLTEGLDFKITFDGLGARRDLHLGFNGEHRLAYAYIEHFDAPSIDDAMTIVLIGINSLSLSATYTTNTPLIYDCVLVRSDDLMQIRAQSSFPAPDQTLGRLLRPDVAELHPFIALYAEGLRSNSPFYRFLSFFKVCERLIDRAIPRARKLFQANSLPAPNFGGVVPADVFGMVVPDVINLKFAAVLAKYRDLYRNSIAHFNLGDPIQPYNLKVEADVRAASMVLSWVAHSMLAQVFGALEMLKARGISLGTLV